MPNARLFIIVAVVLFLVDLVLVLVGSVDHKVIDAILFGGLSAFAAGHL